MASSSEARDTPRHIPCPSNPILLAAQSQWLFTDEELTRAPSQLDGMALEVEHTSRSKGVNFITQVGIMLKLPQPTLATAAVYMNRFFMRYSMVDLPQRPGMHPYPVAATSLFLATKVEENVRKMREFVVACCRVALKQPNLMVDEQSKEFWKWRDTILHHEDLLLEALCFDLQLEQPYRILYDFICFFGVNENKPLRNAAWAFVNDSMFTVLCLQFTARVIAAAALYAAARHCDVAFGDDVAGRPWWEQVDVDLAEVRRACTRMAKLYENNAMQRHSQHYPTTPIPMENASETTRRAYQSAEPQDGAGRKRSREPSQSRANPSSESTAPIDDERSPKRQRVDNNNNNNNNTITPEHDKPRARIPTSAGPRIPSLNGHHHRSSNMPSRPPQAQAQAQARSHTIPRHPYGKGSNPADDPIQQRIDEIVSQSMSPENTASSTARRRERERDGGDRRLSTTSTSSRYDSRRDRDRDREVDDRPPPPPPPPEEVPPPPEDEGSEEGEV
ncbi:hypothetical protein ASPZODRAFT_127537 [Penicilliopsis zonata CBS 506.65]|uniref:RNA polymerase II holoenzyme cyclin-like subunit n=1 Tax=Penicilliopsis zonata CBS 506.65 TaxID=1073090 RepID=A0A1L9SWP6_9EURO|nr:hypothetical protein ASPZODRAFT_127537 [Penicilliopsis zonata CBS 506.65]OJJ51463.1 hypothetical protein ASPZODRAFT_127537 [Penicilliopsis zonata CBS 506.65]